MRTKAMIASLALLIALPAAAQNMFFYPSQGQSPERQNKDKGERHVWAVQQAGFDPANPPAHAATLPAPAPQGGALRGAALGAVGGAIAGDAGKGAAGRGRDRRARWDISPRRSPAGPGTAAGRRAATIRCAVRSAAQQRNSYNRALAACMQGRGYSAG